MKLVTRTFTTTTVHGAGIETVDGQILATPLDPIEVAEDLNEKTAMKYLRKAYPGGKNLVVLSLEKQSQLYGMPVETFLANANAINTETEEN